MNATEINSIYKQKRSDFMLATFNDKTDDLSIPKPVIKKEKGLSDNDLMNEEYHLEEFKEL
jgi:hypothetical protein